MTTVHMRPHIYNINHRRMRPSRQLEAAGRAPEQQWLPLLELFLHVSSIAPVAAKPMFRATETTTTGGQMQL